MADADPTESPFPTALDPFTCNRFEIADFAGRTCLGIAISACAAARTASHPEVAEALGRTPPATRYSADMSKHAFMGTDARIIDEQRDQRSQAGDGRLDHYARRCEVGAG